MPVIKERNSELIFSAIGFFVGLGCLVAGLFLPATTPNVEMLTGIGGFLMSTTSGGYTLSRGIKKITQKE